MTRWILLALSLLAPSLASASGVQHGLITHPHCQAVRPQALHGGKGSVYGAFVHAPAAPGAPAKLQFNLPQLQSAPWQARQGAIHEPLTRPRGPLAAAAGVLLCALLQAGLLSSYRTRRHPLGVSTLWSIRPPPALSL